MRFKVSLAVNNKRKANYHHPSQDFLVTNGSICMLLDESLT